MHNNDFRNNHYNRYSGNRQNNYRQYHFPNSYIQEQDNYRGYRSNQYPNYNDMQEDIASRNLSVSNHYLPSPIGNYNNLSFHQGLGAPRQQLSEPTYIDIRKMNKDFEINIEQGKARLNVYKEYLERSELLMKDKKEYNVAFKACENAYSDLSFVSSLNNIIKDISESLSQNEIYFIEFQNICKGLRNSEENVSNAVKWIQKHRKHNKEHFESILQVIMAFFIMLLHRKNIDKNLVRRLTNIIIRIIFYLGTYNNEYKDLLVKMKGDFSVFYCLMKLHDNEGNLVMNWNSSIQKSLCKIDKVFKELLSENEKCMMAIYKDLMKEPRLNNRNISGLYDPLSFNDEEIANILNKKKAFECEIYINECDSVSKKVKNWLDKECDESRRLGQISGHPSTYTSYENQNSYEEKKNGDNRSWFEKQFYPSYCSLFNTNENNVQFQPIDPSEYGSLEQAKEVSDDIKNLFTRYKNFLDGNTDSIQPVSTNGNEKFNKLMKLKNKLREEIKESTTHENTPYSEYFFNSFDEVEYKDPKEIEKNVRNGNSTLGTHDFARLLSGGRTL